MELRERQWARGLGWFSLGLGLTQVCCPGWLSEAIGLRDTPERRRAFRMLGVREIGGGLAILSHEHPTGGMEARVAGDMMDLTLLGKALEEDGNDRGRVGLAFVAVVGVTMLDWIVAAQLRRT